MNEFVLVEFLFRFDEKERGQNLIEALKDEFVPLKSELNWKDEDQYGYATSYFSVRGKISSETATIIKLSNKFLSEHMRISYIPDELKDKYRNR